MTLVGRTLGGRYDVLERVGSGGMGEVYRARDRELDELVALKVIRTDVDDPDAIERFRNEIKLARRVTHHNVARMFELGWAEGVMFCTMELVAGESLADRLARERRLPAAQAVAVAGAPAAHAAGIIHRDIKPANVLIANDGRVVLADFGIAAADTENRDGNTAGTPAYMAPEQARGEPPTPAADVYAVGVLLYEMLVGQRAFPGPVAKVVADKQEVERLAVTAGDIPGELANVVGRATARRPEDRVPTAAALRRELAPWAPAARATTVPPLHAVAASSERTVVVLAPRGDHDLIYIVEALHEELLGALSRASSGLRVLPRSELTDDDRDVVLRFELAGDTLAVIAERGDGAVPAAALHVPIAIRDIPRVVAQAVRLVEGLFEPAATRGEAYDLLARARSIARRRSLVDQPRALLERAHALAPDDPLVNANHAILLVRSTFFASEIDTTLIPRATEHVRFALATAPHLAESHLAAAHLELHTGAAAVAAGHYRMAIACAPYSAEAHDYLGRMLLEAGYLEAGFARLTQAMSISPHFADAIYQMARAHALEGRWDVVEKLFAEPIQGPRTILFARFARWRDDRSLLVKLRENFRPMSLDPQFAQMLFGVFIDGAWDTYRDQLIALLGRVSPSRRRNAFLAQLVTEAAGYAGDLTTSLHALEHSSSQGLFDRHWMDNCPTLDAIRSTPTFATVRAQVEERAHAIYDALYGDQPIAHSETVLATS
jgi:eukaryotic-like serine/threonine-protein kinase